MKHIAAVFLIAVFATAAYYLWPIITNLNSLAGTGLYTR